MNEKKSSSHIGAGLFIGAAIGIAAASFLQSKKGKIVIKDLKRKTAALQKKVNAELKKAGTMTKDSYRDLVDKVVSYYVKTKDVAETEVPAVREALMSTWKHIEKELRSSKK